MQSGKDFGKNNGCFIVVGSITINYVRREKLNINELPDSLIIAPIYPDTVYFTVQASTRKTNNRKENVGGFHDKTSEMHEL